MRLPGWLRIPSRPQDASPASDQPDDLLQRVRAIEIKARRLVDDRFLGEYQAVFRGSGIAFDELRPYVPGDDVRDIDWKAYARSGEAFIRRYREDRRLTMLFAVDVSASQRAGPGTHTKMDLAAEMCATLALAAARNDDRTGLLLFASTPERYLRPESGTPHVLRVVREVLAARGTSAGTDIGAALEYLTDVHRRRATVFVISDFLADGYEARVRAAAGHHDVIAIVVREATDDRLPAAGLLRLTDPETGETVDVDTESPRVRAAYDHAISERDEARRRLFGEMGIDYLELRVGDDYIGPLLRLFRRRTRRAA